jgi:hypothetical protein
MSMHRLRASCEPRWSVFPASWEAHIFAPERLMTRLICPDRMRQADARSGKPVMPHQAGLSRRLLSGATILRE